MRNLSFLFFAGLALYSGVLIAVEWNTSQGFVRHYFADIDGGRPFFAVNTTLSTFLLTGAALLLIFAGSSGVSQRGKVAKLFCWSQAGMLAFLAFDDRFQLHEALAYRIGVADHFVMAAWAMVECIMLLSLARLAHISLRSALLFAAGGACFVVMMIFDSIVPHDMVLRLSIEDIAKSWAAALFFFAAWFHARFHIGWDATDTTLAQFFHSMVNRRLGKI